MSYEKESTMMLGVVRAGSDVKRHLAVFHKLPAVTRTTNIGVFPKCFHWIQQIQWQKICHYSKRARTCYLLCKRPGCYHSASKIHVRDRIFKSSPIHASLIIRFPEFTEFNESSAPFRKNSSIANCVCGKTPLYRKLNGDKEICTQTIKLLKNRCASGMRTCQGGKVLSMPWVIKINMMSTKLILYYFSLNITEKNRLSIQSNTLTI